MVNKKIFLPLRRMLSKIFPIEGRRDEFLFSSVVKENEIKEYLLRYEIRDIKVFAEKEIGISWETALIGSLYWDIKVDDIVKTFFNRDTFIPIVLLVMSRRLENLKLSIRCVMAMNFLEPERLSRHLSSKECSRFMEKIQAENILLSCALQKISLENLSPIDACEMYASWLLDYDRDQDNHDVVMTIVREFNFTQELVY